MKHNWNEGDTFLNYKKEIDNAKTFDELDKIPKKYEEIKYEINFINGNNIELNNVLYKEENQNTISFVIDYWFDDERDINSEKRIIFYKNNILNITKKVICRGKNYYRNKEIKIEKEKLLKTNEQIKK